MIVRIWHGRIRPEDADRYVEYVRSTGIAAQRATPGNLASFILRRDEGDHCRVSVLSLWESEEAAKAFAGPDPERAIYFPEDGEFLLEMPERLEHHQVAVAQGVFEDCAR